YQRRAKQDDAEVGVAAYRGLRGLNGLQDTLTDTEFGLCDDTGCCFRAAQEILHGHAVAVRQRMHVAGLHRLKFGDAGGLEPGREQGCERFAHNAICCKSCREAGSLAQKSSASACAISTPLTACNPFQAGILLISSTKRRPSPSRMTSTPQ